MTTEELDAIRERAELAATINLNNPEILDVRFMAHSHTDIPKLLDEIERLKADWLEYLDLQTQMKRNRAQRDREMRKEP